MANEPRRDLDPLERPEVQWGVGCLLGMTAMAGMLIIVLLVAIALEPPTWLQVLMGIGLVAVGAALTWLIATALARSKRQERQLKGPTPVDDPLDPPVS
jgi:hypothetical protein